LIQFSDGTFDNPITVSSYNDGTHVRSSGGSDDSTGNTPNNVKYVASGTADWGDGTENCSAIIDGECTLKITVAYDSSITVTDITMWAYDGTTESTAPTNLDVYLFESGDTAWTNADGSGAAMSLTDSDTPATSHDFYVAMSVSPSAVGTQSSNAVKFAFTYQ
jgi:hypothetical protein